MDEKLKQAGIYLGVALVCLIGIFAVLAFSGGLSFGNSKEPFKVWKGAPETGLIAVEVQKGYYRTATVWINEDYECQVSKWRSGNTYYVNIHTCNREGDNFIGKLSSVDLVQIETKKDTFVYPV